MSREGPDGDRRDELLADRALEGLSAEEVAELGRLAADVEAEGLAFDLAAAGLELAFDPPPFEPMPTALRSRIEADAEAHFARVPPRRPLRMAASRVIPWLGWVAAAASLLFALSRSNPIAESPRPPRTPGLVERLASVPPRPLSRTNHPLGREGGGSVVWSGKRQEGYLTVRGLAQVDPSRGIYQLWIFDASRDERFPIDGGTFAVNDPTTTTLVPIHPALAVREPTLFAITLEPPGGVVVSDRRRILLTASVSR